MKIVPINIQELLTPRGLAYWIMDDGSLKNKGLHLNTYGSKATNQEVLNLKSTFPVKQSSLSLFKKKSFLIYKYNKIYLTF